MDLNEIDLSNGDEHTCNVDLTKEELDWVYAYIQLTDDTCVVGRETLDKVCKNVEGMDAAQTKCMRLVMLTASKLLRDGAKKVRVITDDGLSTEYSTMDERGDGLRACIDTLGKDDVEAVSAMAKIKLACDKYGEDFTELVHRIGLITYLDSIRMFHLMKWFLDMRARGLVIWPKGGDEPVVETIPALYKSILETLETWRGEDDYLERVERGAYGPVEVDDDYVNDDAVKAHLKNAINSVYGSSATKTVHPDEDCVLPGCDRYGGNDTYLRIRKVLGHKGAFDFCMGNVIKLVDRWEKKGDPAQNLEKLRDYSAQALVEWRLWNEKLS